MTNIIYAVSIIVGVVVLWSIFSFNRFVRLRFRVKEAWSDIEVQLKRRYDLIPNLVEAVKGYMSHERQIFEKVAEARARAINAQGVEGKAEAENVLSGTLKTLFAVSENYPELKANANFLDLQRELADTENKIQAARRFYNTNVMELNTRVEIFPSKIIASIFRFGKEKFFEIREEERESVEVKF